MQEEESTFLKRYQTRGKITCSNNWRIDRRNAEKALQEESISLKPLKHEAREISLQLMTTRILSFVLFSVTTVTIAEKIKSFQLFKN
jgi:hypothetical protein